MRDGLLTEFSLSNAIKISMLVGDLLGEKVFFAIEEILRKSSIQRPALNLDLVGARAVDYKFVWALLPKIFEAKSAWGLTSVAITCEFDKDNYQIRKGLVYKGDREMPEESDWDSVSAGLGRFLLLRDPALKRVQYVGTVEDALLNALSLINERPSVTALDLVKFGWTAAKAVDVLQTLAGRGHVVAAGGQDGGEISYVGLQCLIGGGNGATKVSISVDA